MSAPAFTPGPWHAIFDDGDWYITGQVGRLTTIVADLEPMMGSKKVEANARLIASAPELYEAARLWAEYDALLRKYTGPQPVLYDGDAAEIDAAYDRARDATFAALAKARGEQ